MNKWTYIIILFLLLTNVTGQTNLVNNPSFEDTIVCPTLPGIDNAKAWHSHKGTPDLFASCSSVLCCSNPTNFQGILSPFNGNNYAGFYNYLIYGWYYTESMYSKLKTPLTIGSKYFFSMVTALSDSSNCGSGKLGIRFTVDSNFVWSSFADTNYYNNKAKIVFSKALTHNWLLQSGSFIADSAYKYICVGNFFRQPLVDTLIIRNVVGMYYFSGSGITAAQCVSYNFIDDLKLSTDSNFVNQTIGIKQIDSQMNNFHIFPNPTNDKTTIKFSNTKKEKFTFILYNAQGQVTRTINNITGDAIEIHKSDLSIGLYFFVLQTETKLIGTGKLIFE